MGYNTHAGKHAATCSATRPETCYGTGYKTYASTHQHGGPVDDCVQLSVTGLGAALVLEDAVSAKLEHAEHLGTAWAHGDGQLHGPRASPRSTWVHITAYAVPHAPHVMAAGQWEIVSHRPPMTPLETMKPHLQSLQPTHLPLVQTLHFLHALFARAVHHLV